MGTDTKLDSTGHELSFGLAKATSVQFGGHLSAETQMMGAPGHKVTVATRHGSGIHIQMHCAP
jgi:hypothetical protein